MSKIYELKYSNTNTYLIEGSKGKLLFDTGWAGTFPMFCQCMGQYGIPVQEINYILISHFHPDHCGIAQEIASKGATILVMDVQKDFVHSADAIFAKDNKTRFFPIDDHKVKIVKCNESRSFLKEIGIDGEILSTPGHSDDSISLMLDSGELFVGDLNPLYELELHKGTQIGESWEKLLERNPKIVYYGHAKTAVLSENSEGDDTQTNTSEVSSAQIKDKYELVSKIMKYIDKGLSLERIQKKTGAEKVFIEDVTRMYLTHQNVGVQGILDRIEIKGK